jgi:hypothetical protein
VQVKGEEIWRWRKKVVLAYTPQFPFSFFSWVPPSFSLTTTNHLFSNFLFSPPFFYNQIPQSFFPFVFSNFKSFFKKIPSNFPVFFFFKAPSQTLIFQINIRHSNKF